MQVGQSLVYGGTIYKIKEVTEDAVCLGSNADQLLWVSKAWLVEQDCAVRIGRSPAWVHL